MTKLLRRLGAICATASLVLFEAPATRSDEEPMTVRAPQRMRTAPAAEHLGASYDAADAVFGAQRSAEVDPALEELREGLAEVRVASERLIERHVASHTSYWRVTGANGEERSIGEAPSKPADDSLALATASERELRDSLARLRTRIEEARSRTRLSPMNAELLGEATRKASDLEAQLSAALDAQSEAPVRDLRGFVRRLEVRELRDEASGSIPEDGQASVLGPAEADPQEHRPRQSPTLSTITRHRTVPAPEAQTN